MSDSKDDGGGGGCFFVIVVAVAFYFVIAEFQSHADRLDTLVRETKDLRYQLHSLREKIP